MDDTLQYSNEVAQAQSTCALRFLGYDYEEAAGIVDDDATGSGLSELIEPVVKNLILHDSQNDNFAAFFGLQRFLGKWGGERLTKYSDEHIAYDFLFLHLYDHEPQTPFRHDEYCLKWQRQFAPNAQSLAAVVRRSFRRVGEGQKIML